MLSSRCVSKTTMLLLKGVLLVLTLGRCFSEAQQQQQTYSKLAQRSPTSTYNYVFHHPRTSKFIPLTSQGQTGPSGYNVSFYADPQPRMARRTLEVAEPHEPVGEEPRSKLKKYRRYMLPLLLAYKLKFFTLVPLLMGGLVLLAGSTGLAGFFFALFAATMGLKVGGGHS